MTTRKVPPGALTLDPARTRTLAACAADYVLLAVVEQWRSMDAEQRAAWLDYHEAAGELQLPRRFIARLLDGSGELAGQLEGIEPTELEPEEEAS